MIVFHETDVIENVNSAGRRKFWQGRAFSKDGKVFTQALFWQELEGGGTSKVNESDPVEITRPKGQDTIEDQAVFDIESAKRKQLDKISSNERPLPMKAKDYADHKAKIKFPCYVQPKYDGYRMLQRDGDAWSRMGKDQVFECVEHLLCDTQGLTLDGEVILPLPFIRQETRSAATKFRPDKSPFLKYRVYDIVDEKMPFSKRIKVLEEFVLAANNPNIIITPTFLVNNEEEANAYFKTFREQGEEGLMFRNVDAGYEVNKRSYHLQKLKEWLEAEFWIKDVVPQDKRPDEGMVVVDLGNNNFCTVNVEGTREFRAELLANRENVIGQLWTVRFQAGLTKEGKLQFATAVCERDDDLDGESNMFTDKMYRSLIRQTVVGYEVHGASNDEG